nr:hypothetical protein [Burkholderia sp. Ac-20345]
MVVDVDNVEVLALTTLTAVDNEASETLDPPPDELGIDDMLLFIVLRPVETDAISLAITVDSDVS